jgi:hypothetical protein
MRMGYSNEQCMEQTSQVDKNLSDFCFLNLYMIHIYFISFLSKNAIRARYLTKAFRYSSKSQLWMFGWPSYKAHSPVHGHEF